LKYICLPEKAISTVILLSKSYHSILLSDSAKSTMLFIPAQISLTFSLSSWLFLIAAVAVLAWTLWIYRRTNPVVSAAIRALLIAARILSLALILLVLFEAAFGLHYTFSRAPVLAVAIDNSASMAVRETSGLRSEMIQRVLHDDFLKQLRKRFELKFFSLTGQVQEVAPQNLDSLRYNGDVTNLAEGLETIKGELSEENLAGILLLSDGNYNQGGNPVRYAGEIGTPIYSIGIGSTEAMPDMAITDVEANAFAYVGEPTRINATIRSIGYFAERTSLMLREGNGAISTQMVNTPQSPAEIQVAFEYVPKSQSRQKLVLDLATRDNEQTPENNRRTVYLDVLKSHLKILLIAGGISPDISFLRRHLAASERYEVHAVIEKNNGGFYSLPSSSTVLEKLDDIDIFVLFDFPTLITDPAILSRLAEAIQTKSIPVLFIPGKDLVPTKLAKLEQFLPVSAKYQNINETQVFPLLSPAGQDNPITRIAGETEPISSAWAQLPPVYVSNVFNPPWPNSEVLAYAIPAGTAASGNKEERKWPLLLLRSNGRQKSAAILAYGLWRWDLMMWGIDSTYELYPRLIGNVTRWLESVRSDELVRIDIGKTSFHYGEPVEIKVELFDDKHHPVNNAEVTFRVKQQSGEGELLANQSGEGQYTLALHPEQSGDYEIRAIAREGDRKIGEAEALFSVGEYSKELIDTRMQETLLRGVSSASGGIYASADSLFILARDIAGDEQKITSARETELWNNPFILAAIILFLTLEWFLRKRKGMV
jgi:hypothetical protein